MLNLGESRFFSSLLAVIVATERSLDHVIFFRISYARVIIYHLFLSLMHLQRVESVQSFGYTIRLVRRKQTKSNMLYHT